MVTGRLSSSLQETLAVFEEAPPGTPFTTNEVTEHLDVGRRSVYNRLEKLVAADRLQTKSVGSRGRVWWREPSIEPTSPPADLDELFSRIEHAFLALDTEWRITYLNEAAASIVEGTREEVRGELVWDVFTEVVDDVPQRQIKEAFETNEPTVFDYYSAVLDRWYDVQAYPSETGVSVYFQDVTESKRREEQLERYETILETIDDGVYVVDDDGRFELVNDAYADLLGYEPAELVGRDASDFVDETTAARAQTFEEALFEGERDTARIVADVRRRDGSTFRGEATFTTFERPDGSHGRVGVVRDITDRARREEELERQRERLAALNDLNRVVHEIIDTVIEQSTRESVEAVVCQSLADADSYLFAWIGEIDTMQQTVSVRTEAGVEGYLDDTTISVDPTDPRSQGATGRAVIDREIQVTSDVADDDRYDQWREHVEEYGFRSSAAVPILHGDTVYGVLNVYSERPHAFAAEEADLLEHLGEVIGHVIASLERKRALMSDEIVELEFQIDDIVGAYGDVGSEGRLTIDRMVPAGDHVYLTYGTVSSSLKPLLEEFVAELPHWQSVEYLEDTADGSRYEARLEDPPVLSTVTELGGYVDHAAIDGGDYFMRIHLAPNADTGRVVDAVTDFYSGAKLVTRRQRSRAADSPEQYAHLLQEALTERQRTVLDAAFSAGYFESPRTRSGETIAASLDITATTFHQHLRKAQQRVFEALLGSSSDDE